MLIFILIPLSHQDLSIVLTFRRLFNRYLLNPYHPPVLSFPLSPPFGRSTELMETQFSNQRLNPSHQVEAPNPKHWNPRELPGLIPDCSHFEGIEYVLHPPGKLLYSFLFQIVYYLCNPIVIYYFGVLGSFTPVQVSCPYQ